MSPQTKITTSLEVQTQTNQPAGMVQNKNSILGQIVQAVSWGLAIGLIILAVTLSILFLYSSKVLTNWPFSHNFWDNFALFIPIFGVTTLYILGLTKVFSWSRIEEMWTCLAFNFMAYLYFYNEPLWGIFTLFLMVITAVLCVEAARGKIKWGYAAFLPLGLVVTIRFLSDSYMPLNFISVTSFPIKVLCIVLFALVLLILVAYKKINWGQYLLITTVFMTSVFFEPVFQWILGMITSYFLFYQIVLLLLLLTMISYILFVLKLSRKQAFLWTGGVLLFAAVFFIHGLGSNYMTHKLSEDDQVYLQSEGHPYD